MSTFDSLTLALEEWFDRPLHELPAELRQRVELEFFPMPWNYLGAERRRSVALQLDYQHDPATEQDRQDWWELYERMDVTKAHIARWDAAAAPTAGELALKEARLTELGKELALLEAQGRQARGDYFPKRKEFQVQDEEPLTKPAVGVRYIAYPKAMHQLAARLGATPEELAAWVWMGPDDGGIAAYVNAIDFDPPPRFHFGLGGEFDYLSPLMASWFAVEEIAHFEPTERYITGTALIKRWGEKPGLQPEAFILAKIAESRLQDIHPMYGGTRGTFREHDDFPPLTSGLFLMSQVEQIEADDFEAQEKPIGTSAIDKKAVIEEMPADSEAGPIDVIPRGSPSQIEELGSAKWRKANAQSAANARHDKPGGSRDKKRQLQEIWASGKYTSRDICAEEECAGMGMSYTTARRALINTPEPSRC